MSVATRLTALLIPALMSLAAQASDTLHVKDAWTRATPPGAANSATYLELHNSGDESRAIVAVKTTVAMEVQLHTVIDDNGLMKMRQVPQIDVPAGGKAVLAPGGFHLMMMGINYSLREGETVEIELRFANGERLVFESPIKKMAGMKMMDHNH